MSRPFQVYLGSVPNSENDPGESAWTYGGDTFSYASWLEPIHLAHKGNGGITELRVVGDKHPEAGDAAITMNQMIVVRDMRTAFGNDSVIFSGTIVKKRMSWQGEQEQFDIVAYSNPDYLLHRIVIHGQTRLTYDRESTYFTAGYNATTQTLDIALETITIDTHCVLNPDGEPNMMQQQWKVDLGGGDFGPTFPIFDAPFRDQFNATGDEIKAVPWTLSKAVAYLLNLYNVSWCIDPDSYSDVNFAVLSSNGEDPILSDINLEGKTLFQALTEILEPLDFGFYCSMKPNAVTGKHNIKFYYRPNGANSQNLTFATRGTRPPANTSANVITADLMLDSTATVNSVEAIGDRIVFTTLAHTNPTETGALSGIAPYPTLVRGWKDSDLIWAYNTDGTVNDGDDNFNADYVQCVDLLTDVGDAVVYGIGRLWLVNLGESPDYSLEDLTSDLNNNANGGNSIDPRKFERPQLYTANAAGGQLTQEDIQVEFSFDAGTTWLIAEKTWYRVLPSNMGIVWTEPVMEVLGQAQAPDASDDAGTYWQALHDAVVNGTKDLQIRVLMAIKSDEHVKEKTFNDAIATPLATARLFENDAYKKSKYNPAINGTVYYTKFSPKESATNDETHLQDMVTQQLSYTNRVICSGSAAIIMGTIEQWTPGTQVTVVGRTTSINSKPTVQMVVYDFVSLHTQITMDNHNVRAIVKAKPVVAADYAAHRLGVGALAPMDAEKVPWKTLAERRKYYEAGGQ